MVQQSKIMVEKIAAHSICNIHSSYRLSFLMLSCTLIFNINTVCCSSYYVTTMQQYSHPAYLLFITAALQSCIWQKYIKHIFEVVPPVYETPSALRDIELVSVTEVKRQPAFSSKSTVHPFVPGPTLAPNTINYHSVSLHINLQELQELLLGKIYFTSYMHLHGASYRYLARISIDI